MGKNRTKLSAFGKYLKLGLIIGNFVYGVSIMHGPLTLKCMQNDTVTSPFEFRFVVIDRSLSLIDRLKGSGGSILSLS